MQIKNKLDKLIVIGDKVLIKPKSHNSTTKAGLYLPPGVKEKESIQSGYVVKVGPGYALPVPRDPVEDWKPSSNEPEYIPLQPKEGDLAIYLQNSSYEIEFEGDKYFIVPQHGILLLIREDD